MGKQLRKISQWFGSKACFVVILMVSAISSAWIAVSSVYPMAFDEDYHLGLIKIYSHRWLPFFSSQPTNTSQYSAFTREPSYVYHYLMSFPWRIITMLTHNFMVQVITMRLLNVALFLTGLALFRLLLLRSKFSPQVINLALLLFILTPLTPLVAAQINYDNLLFPLLALNLILVIDFSRQLKAREFSWTRLAIIFSLGLITCLVKYVYLPMFIASGLYIIWLLGVWARRDWPHLKQTIVARAHNLSLKRLRLVAVVVMVVLSCGLAFERLGLNVIRYHAPQPDCSQVLTTEQCMAFGPWKRNYDIKRATQPSADPNPFLFSYSWMRHMAFNLAFTLNGPASDFSIGNPLPFPNWIILAFSSLGLMLIVASLHRLLKDDVLRVCFLAMLTYLSALWLKNYSEYLELKLPTAIQGRYLLPVLIVAYLAMAVAITNLIGNRHIIKLLSASMVIGIFLMGGGALTFILRSDDSWYWSNKPIISTNLRVRKALQPIIPGAKPDLNNKDKPQPGCDKLTCY